jgi:CRP/FNR family transcriptional regulator, cyclic AMP receptor protein
MPVVKRLLARFRSSSERPVAHQADDAGFFATQLMEREDSTQVLAPWGERAAELNATPCNREQALPQLTQWFSRDPLFGAVPPDALTVICGYFEFVRLDSGQQLMAQDEQGDYLAIVLQGVVADERTQPSGTRARVCESRAGDVLGDLSMLEDASRLCSSTALTPLTVAILSRQALETLLAEEPVLAALLLAWLGKRISLHLRQTSARLSVQLTRSGHAD